MNYNADTEMDMTWSADQARRLKLMGSGLPDAPVRRVTATLPRASTTPRSMGRTMTPRSARGEGAFSGCDPTSTLTRGSSASGDATVGNALSALTINLPNTTHCARTCHDILMVLADRDRIAVHTEFVQLRGIENVLEVVKTHDGETVLVGLQILDKLSRTSARELSAAGGIDIVVRCCEKLSQAPRVIEAGLRVLHGLTFDNETKLLLLRRGVRELAEGIAEHRPAHGATAVIATVPLEEHVQAAGEAWQDVYSMATRLLQRMGGSGRGGLKRLP